MLILVTPPSPILSAAQAKARAPALADAADVLVEGEIKAATEIIDGRDGLLGRAIGAQTWDWKPDCETRSAAFWRNGWRVWPGYEYLELPLPDLQSVTSIKYLDSNGDTQTWASSNYHVSGIGGRGRVTLKSGSSWPTLGDYPEPITIRFVAGFTTVPDIFKKKIAEAALAGFVAADREPGIASVTTDAGSVAYSFAANRTPRSIMLDAVKDGELAAYRVF